jgi:hypothetical protein
MTVICFHRTFGERRCPGVQVCCELPEEDKAFVTTSPPPSSCGIRGGSLDTTVVRILTDNNPTQFSEFPWMLALLREDTESGSMQYRFQCGASLIHPQVAVTAAHCVSRYFVLFTLLFYHLNEHTYA